MLTGNFTKRSKVAVVYVCYERAEIIRSTLAALLKSEGLGDVDVYISQDGGSGYEVEVPAAPGINILYVRHPVNLCPGQHHYFVKSLAFDIMGYEALIVVEEDNLVHPDAIKVLRGMLDLSAGDPQIGLVSITDMDNSLLLDEVRHNASVLRVDVEHGHLWVYGLHASRYKAVQQDLRDYLNVIKGRDYSHKDQPPLRDDIQALIKAKGMPAHIPLSQDAFTVNSLIRAGYTHRFTTMVRLFEPVGWQGLHFHQDPSAFYGVFGRGMYEGRVTGPPRELGRVAQDVEDLKSECLARLNVLYQNYLGRDADEGAAQAAVRRMMVGKLNAVELLHNMINSAEHRRRMKVLTSQSGRASKAKS